MNGSIVEHLRLTCVLCAVLATGGVTLEAAVGVAVSPGFRGLSAPRHVMPVFVTLTGDGLDHQLDIVVEGTPAARRRVELARGTTKRVVVYTHPDKGFGAGPPLLTVQEGEEVLRREELDTQVLHLQALVPVVGGPSLEIDGVQSPVLSRDVLPDRADGYEALRALVIYPDAWSALEGSVLEALVLWVRQGGLIVLPLRHFGTALKLGPEHPFGPLAPASTQEWNGLWRGLGAELDYREEVVRAAVERQRLEPWDRTTVSGMPNDVSRTLAVWAEARSGELERIPLLAERRFGGGRVRLLAFDPMRWKRAETREVRDKFLSVLTSEHEFRRLPQALRSQVLVERGALQRLSWFFLFLVIYLLLIGPVDYFLVRRLRRPRATWLTFPCMVLVFCVVAWAMGRGRIGALVTREVTVVDCLGGRAQGAVGLSFVGVYSDTNESLSFRPRIPRAEVDLIQTNLDLFGGRWAYDQKGSTAELVQKMNIWSTHGYRVAWRERETYLAARWLEREGQTLLEVEQNLPTVPLGGWVRTASGWRSLSDWKSVAGEASFTAVVGEAFPLSAIRELAHSLEAESLRSSLFDPVGTDELGAHRLVVVLPEPGNVLEVVQRGSVVTSGFTLVRCPVTVMHE